MSKRGYLSIIRITSFLHHFLIAYFIKMVVVYLLANDVTPWVAVSIPVVLEFSRMIARGFKWTIKLALKVDYKKMHIFHFVAFTILAIIISQCSSVWSIYLFTIIAGIITGIKGSSATKFSTSNKEYESYCLIEDERFGIIGLTLGYIISQFVYDISMDLYIVCYFAIGVLGIIISLFVKEAPVYDSMISFEECAELSSEDKKNSIVVSLLFGFIAGLWCMALSALDELGPLISDKVGYLTSIYTIVEFICLFIISGSILAKIKKKKKLLLVETVIACVDCLCLLISSLFMSWVGLLIAFVLSGVFSTLGDPIWASIISSYSTDNRKKYALINRVYFITRSIATIVSWGVCRWCVINGLEYFRYLAVILLILIIVLYFIANKINKKVFNTTI